MSTINSNITCDKLQTKLNQYYSPDNAVEDVMSLALSAQIFDTKNTITVPTLNQLPNLVYNTNIQNGMVYYIQDIDVHAVSSNGVWLSLDGRTIRTDIIFEVAWTWGTNCRGQLGDETVISKSSPVSVVGISDWCQISTGGILASGAHVLGVRSNKTLWAWGYNTCGRLGDNTTVNKSSPILVLGGFTDWSQVDAGSTGSIGVRTNGTAWTWGINSNGQLGDISTVNKSSPVSVCGGFTDWCQVSAGGTSSGGHNAGVRTNGTVWAWGVNSSGQIGNGTTVNTSSPVSVVGGFTDWCQVSAGGSHDIGIRTNGTVWAWGLNSSGQIGNGTTVNTSSPVSVVGGFTDWCQVSAGYTHNLGVRTNGTAWAWGNNGSGRLGDNTNVNKSSPVSVVGGFTNWCQVSAGTHSAGVRTNSTAWTWGCNNLGQLGDGTTVDKSSPVSVVGGFTNWNNVQASNGASVGTIKKV